MTGRIWFSRHRPVARARRLSAWPVKKKLLRITGAFLKLAPRGVYVKQLGSTTRECHLARRGNMLMEGGHQGGVESKLEDLLHLQGQIVLEAPSGKKCLTWPGIV
jgi:hypothetical protein